MKKKSEVYDGTQQGTFNSGGGDWGKQLGYHIIDFSSEYQIDDKKSKSEIIDKVLKEYTKRKEGERKNWEKLNPDGKGREVK